MTFKRPFQSKLFYDSMKREAGNQLFLKYNFNLKTGLISCRSAVRFILKWWRILTSTTEIAEIEAEIDILSVSSEAAQRLVYLCSKFPIPKPISYLGLSPRLSYKFIAVIAITILQQQKFYSVDISGYKTKQKYNSWHGFFQLSECPHMRGWTRLSVSTGFKRFPSLACTALISPLA